MKRMKRKVKGFTLIELIVVLAIFGIILAAATSMMLPVSKAAIETDVMSSGNVAVQNYTKALEGSISTAEYLRVYSGPLGRSMEEEVVDFAKTYYGGVLKANCTAAAPDYGKGLVHVMVVDATTGKVSEWIYQINSFNEASMTATLIQDGSAGQPGEFVVNKAYYDDYTFQLKPGTYSTVEAFDAFTPGPTDIATQVSANAINLSIKATTQRNAPGTTGKTEYSFVSNASIPLVNQRFGTDASTSVKGVYFCVDKVTIPDPADPTNTIVTNGIVDRGLDTLQDHTPILARARVAPAGDGSQYIFVYSYGSEIDTN